MIKRTLVLALGLILLAGVTAALGALSPGGSFSDDDGNIHEGSIEAIAAAGITKGCNPPTNDLYCPSDTVNRGQMAAFLTRALGLTERLDNPFADDDGSIFEADIERMAAAGITKGCNPPTNDMFCPDNSVTRGQMAAFLVRALGYTDVGAGDLFTDDDGLIFETDIDRLGTAGVTKGCNPPVNDQYCPDSPVLRDQMAAFLARALDLDPIIPPPPTSTTTTTTTTIPAANTFGDGAWIVGTDIAPGTYRTDASPDTCYGKRLSGFSGDFDDIIANELSDNPIIVTIEPTDAGFESKRCGLWTDDMTPRTNSPTAGFSDGDWLVGTEVAPGLWRNSDSSDTCYWKRLSGFSWEFRDIIANGLADSIQTVQIDAGDTGFSSNRCGDWTYLGP